MRIINLDQAGPSWHRWRKQGLGASDAPTILGENPYSCADELIEQKTGRKEVRENEAMRRGKRLEPQAREAYMALTGIRVTPVCVEHDTYSWLRASLDGLSEDGQIVLEIKCPRSPRGHITALEGRVPLHYWGQVQHQLAATGCPKLHFFSYTDSEQFAPEQRCALVRVLPDLTYIERLIEREKAFWERLQRDNEQNQEVF